MVEANNFCPVYGQDLVFGDATSKEVINYLSANTDIPAEDKVGA